jgi:hypothetical protein
MGRTTTSISRAPFVVDPHSIVRLSGRQIDWAHVATSFYSTAVVVTVGTGGAAQGATTVPVTALPGALPNGTTLDFGGAKFARLTAAAAAGATSLTVAALPTAVVAGDTATYVGPNGKKTLPAGTVVGSLLGSGKVSPRIVTTNPAIGVLETSAVEGETQAALTGYGVIAGGILYENLLPDASGSPKVLATAVKTELNANGTGFAFEQYGDSRA